MEKNQEDTTEKSSSQVVDLVPRLPLSKKVALFVYPSSWHEFLKKAGKNMAKIAQIRTLFFSAGLSAKCENYSLVFWHLFSHGFVTRRQKETAGRKPKNYTLSSLVEKRRWRNFYFFLSFFIFFQFKVQCPIIKSPVFGPWKTFFFLSHFKRQVTNQPLEMGKKSQTTRNTAGKASSIHFQDDPKRWWKNFRKQFQLFLLKCWDLFQGFFCWFLPPFFSDDL